MSRKREYLADAGAVELTKDPDAMISALKRISGHSEIEAPSQIQEMFLDHPKPPGFAGLFATHPSIEDRVSALVHYAGGHDLPLKPTSLAVHQPADPSGLSAPPQPHEPADPSAIGRRSGPAPDAAAPHPWGDTPSGPWDEPRS
jgi:heat shock protein HtpX